MPFHRPVLASEVTDALVTAPGGRFIDATVGGGGHARALLEAAGPDARLLGIDRDDDALREATTALAPFGARVLLVHGRFSDATALARQHGFDGCDGLVADLGVSSHQIDDRGRGLAFDSDALLDMRMDRSAGESVAALLTRLDAPSLSRLLREYGEVRRPSSVARAILRQPLPTTPRALAERVGGSHTGRRHHPATLVFQALRIAVNDELAELDALLAGLPAPLGPGGRIAVIAYHSLEDRRVKRAFTHAATTCTCPPALPICACETRPSLLLGSRRAAKATPEEQADNPRSRSARLRIATRPEEETA